MRRDRRAIIGNMAHADRLDAQYQIVRLPGGEAYGIEVTAEGKAPAFILPFRTKKAAYIWIQEHKWKVGAAVMP